MKGTRVFIPEDVEAVGRFVSVKTGLPIAEVYTILLSLATEGVDPSTLSGMVERKAAEATRAATSTNANLPPF